MWKKVVFLGICSLGIQLSLWASPGNAYEYEDTPTEVADGIHIPKKITLLEDIPYYVIPNALLNKAEGALAPQTVEVIEAEIHYSSGWNWWKIHTDFGDRWIKTASWQFEAPPPTTITLMSETPLYAKPSENSRPTAALSPQEVQVVDAEKGWFRNSSGTGDVYNPKKWLKIHTTWLGDQWIHLKLDQIGSFQSADHMSYFSNYYYNLKPQYDYQTYQTDGTLVKQFAHVTGKFRNLLGTYYQLDTAEGVKWVFGGGEPIVAETKTIPRTHPSALYAYPSSQYVDDPKLIVNGDLTAFEKTYNDYITNYGYDGDWFHVRTPQGEGWFNPKFAEPEDAVAETATIQLSNPITYLFRYPNTGIIMNHGQLGPQTIRPIAAWTDPNGIRWFQINSFVGKAWIRLEPQQNDRLIRKDRTSDMQIKGDYTYQNAFIKRDGIYALDNETLGYEIQGEPYFISSFVAKLYNFNVTGPDMQGWWTLTNTSGYSFQIKTGELLAKTRWKGYIANTVTLAKPATAFDKEGSPLLSLTDIRTLFGATSTTSADNEQVVFNARQYDVSAFQQLPILSDEGHVHLSGLVYESLYDYSSIATQTESQNLQITITDRDPNGLSSKTNTSTTIFLYKLNGFTGLYDISLDHPLKPGNNPLTITYKVGERIILQRDWDVLGPAKE